MKSISRLPAILVLCATAQAHANDPADPSAHTSSPIYRSAFDGYISASEQTPPTTQHEAGSQQDAHAGHGRMHHQQAAEMSRDHMEHGMHMHPAHQMEEGQQ